MRYIMNPIKPAADEGTEDFHDLVEAARSSIGFWDNPLDDEDWSAPAVPRDRCGKIPEDG